MKSCIFVTVESTEGGYPDQERKRWHDLREEREELLRKTFIKPRR